MKVIYECDPTSASGYAKASRNHMRSLIEAGVEVVLESKCKDTLSIELDPFWKANMDKISKADKHNAHAKIWHETPEFYNPDPSIVNIGFVAWETSRIPSTDIANNSRFNWVTQLNRMDAVWVPCSSNKAALKSSGVTKPIYVIPHPVYFGETEEPKPLVPKDVPFTLLSVFQWQPRKDPVSMILGYYLADLPSKLLLKTYGSTFQKDNEDIVKRIKSIKNTFHKAPIGGIVPILDKLSEEQIQQLYRSADVYICTSKGEGACLPVLEAMAAGIPAIVPDNSAFMDFITPDCVYSINTREEPVHGMGHIPWYSPDQIWWPVDIGHTTSLIQLANEDRQRTESFEGKELSRLEIKGIRSKRLIQDLFSSSFIGERMLESLHKEVQCTITI